ncbi:hypothetical protein VKS41_007818 [Umbelopsis sp. WA50703]
MDYSQDLKRKNIQDHTDMSAAKRAATIQPPSPFDTPLPHNNPYSMSAPPSTCGLQQLSPHPSNDANIPRCKSPPLGMTLAHFDPASGGYATSVLKSEETVSAPICSGMTPAYRPPIERWGSCML